MHTLGAPKSLQAYHQAVALGACGALAHGLLAALVAGFAVDAVVDAGTVAVIAIHKELPASMSKYVKTTHHDGWWRHCHHRSYHLSAHHPIKHTRTTLFHSLPKHPHAAVCNAPLQHLDPKMIAVDRLRFASLHPMTLHRMHT